MELALRVSLSLPWFRVYAFREFGFSHPFSRFLFEEHTISDVLTVNLIEWS